MKQTILTIIRLSYMFYMMLMIHIIIVIQFGIHIAHNNIWGISEDLGASLLMWMTAGICAFLFITVAEA